MLRVCCADVLRMEWSCVLRVCCSVGVRERKGVDCVASVLFWCVEGQRGAECVVKVDFLVVVVVVMMFKDIKNK